MSYLSALPECFALRSKHDNSSYLHSVYDESHGGSLMELRSGDGGLMNPRARFYLEPSKEHEGLTHIKCCYNNQYWVPQQRMLPGTGSSARWVIGTAHEPEEDLSKSLCTLHQLIPNAGDQAEEDGSTTCRFLHSKLGIYACKVSSMPVRSHLHIASQEDKANHQDGGGLIRTFTLTDDIIDAFTLINVSYLKQLPKYVAFKGDNDVVLYSYYWPKFDGSDIGHERALHTVYTNDDGVVWILANHQNYFWCLDDGRVWIEVNRQGGVMYYGESTFRVITGNGFVALQNLKKNGFCKRLNSSQGDHCDYLAAPDDSVSITESAKLKVVEPVLSREIYNVDFRLNEAKTYTTGVKGLDSQTVKNHSNVANHQTLSFSWTSKVESTWSSTVSMKICISISISCGVPFFAEGKIDTSTEFSADYTWGETKSEEKTITRSVEVEVPPMKKVTVRAIGTDGVCDIPFSYMQKDVLLNGQVFTNHFNDGLYKGVKTSDVTFDIIEEDL